MEKGVLLNWIDTPGGNIPINQVVEPTINVFPGLEKSQLAYRRFGNISRKLSISLFH
jgi:hypothetical protein